MTFKSVVLRHAHEDEEEPVILLTCYSNGSALCRVLCDACETLYNSLLPEVVCGGGQDFQDDQKAALGKPLERNIS